VFEAAELDLRVSKREFAARIPALRSALLAVQHRLATSRLSVVVVIAGVEGSGKGAMVNALLDWLDARGVGAHALGIPSSEEAERPPLYRFWRRLPPRGEIGIFFGSWYTGPIVAHVTGGADDDRFDRELDRIVDFERMLVDENVLVVKFWLHITKSRQRKVFRKLEANPDTAWRVTPADWDFHDTYDDFVATSARALRVSDTARARWFIVAARDKRHTLLSVGEQLLDSVSKALDAQIASEPQPEPPPVPKPVNVVNAIDLGAKVDADRYRERLATLQGRLGRLAHRMAESERAAVLLFEGPDAAGKGGAIRRVIRALDARWYRVVPIAAPTDEELARPYLWRFWRRLPARGHWTIYDRSWYGRVLVERIENLCPPEAWRRAYREINAFEEQLVESGILVFKFWLAISPEEQLRRFQDRRATPYKRYKITQEDWRNRDKWLAYEAAASDMIERTSTEIAPWNLVAAEDKRHARLEVLDALCGGLERALGKQARVKKQKDRKKK